MFGFCTLDWQLRTIFTAGRSVGKTTLGNDLPPPQINCLHDAAQSLAHVWRNCMPLMRPLLRHRKFRLRIEHDKIRVTSRRDAPLARTASSEARRAVRHPTRDISQPEPALLRFGPNHRQRDREARNPSPRRLEISLI